MASVNKHSQAHARAQVDKQPRDQVIALAARGGGCQVSVQALASRSSRPCAASAQITKMSRAMTSSAQSG